VRRRRHGVLHGSPSLEGDPGAEAIAAGVFFEKDTVRGFGANRSTGSRYSNLLAWAEALNGLVPWKENGFIVWRSGIYASNATGAVSFCVGDRARLPS
jgi:hypothetical protein